MRTSNQFMPQCRCGPVARPVAPTAPIDLALFHPIADLHVEPRQVQEVAAHAMAVVEQQRAAGEVEVRRRERHHAGGRRLDRRAGRRGDVHAGMRRFRRAVVDALVAEAAADAALHRPGEGLWKSMRSSSRARAATTCACSRAMRAAIAGGGFTVAGGTPSMRSIGQSRGVMATRACAAVGAGLR